MPIVSSRAQRDSSKVGVPVVLLFAFRTSYCCRRGLIGINGFLNYCSKPPYL